MTRDKDGPTDNGAEESIQVFVSYARNDATFVDKLEHELEPAGIKTLIDREQIASFEAWWDRITELMGRAHSVLFVLSPDWLQSDVCRNELDLAIKMRKRLAPVVHRPIPVDEVPAELARLNWVFLRSEDDIAAGTTRLVDAMRTNINWIRKQTRISEQAQYWHREERTEATLLQEDALFAAERLLAHSPPNAPPTAALVYEFLDAGREVYERNERARKTLLDRTLVSQSQMLAERANQWLEHGDAVSAVLLSLEALPDEARGVNRPLVAAAEVACIRALYCIQEHRVFSYGCHEINEAVLSDDGKRVMARSDEGVLIWDVESGNLIAALDQKPVAYSADGKFIATLGEESTYLWQLDQTDNSPRLHSEYSGLHDQKLWKVLATCQHGWVVIQDQFERMLHREEFLNAKVPVALSKSFKIEDPYDRLRVSIDGERIVTTPFFNLEFPTTVVTWNAKTGAKLAELKGHQSYVHSAEFNSNRTLVATASADGTARVWLTESGELLAMMRGHENHVTCARFSPDSTLLVTGSFDNSFRLWDVPSGEQINVLKGHVGEVPKTTDLWKGFSPKAHFSSDGRQIVTTWKDRTVRLWDVIASGSQRVLTNHRSKVNSVSCSPDGSRFASASSDGTVAIWETATAQMRKVIGPLDNEVRDIAFNSSGQKLAGGVGDRIIIWDADTGEEVATIPTETVIFSLAFSPSGAQVATTSFDDATIWDINTATQICSFTTGYFVYCVNFAPSGLVAVSCGDEGTIHLWNTKTGRQLKSARFHETSIMSVAFDVSGERIVTGSDDLTSRIWDINRTTTGDNIVVLSGHSGVVRNASFSPSGDHVVTASEDRTVRLWDATTGEQLAVFKGHSDIVTKAVFSPSGDLVISCSHDGDIRLWKVFQSTQELTDHARRVVPRALTREQRETSFLDPEPPKWCAEMEKWPYVDK
jgi:WD40 repeat protein